MDEQVLRSAIEKWGERSQQEMIKEEAIELALAMQKYHRNPSGLNRSKLIDELADMKVMLRQAEMMFGEEAINNRAAYKVDRLKKRIEKSNYELA